MQNLDKNRFALLNSDLVEEASNQVHIVETKKDGEADLTLLLSAASILFGKMDDNSWAYFENKKCADYLLLEQYAGRYRMHIFELKRSISEKTWDSMKLQFQGGLQHSLALAGVLGISLELSEVQLYSVYRNDKINDSANPARTRLQMYEGNGKTNRQTDWNHEKIKLEFPGVQKFSHHKVKLDIETGTAVYQIA